MTEIAIIGAGAWGTALAATFGRAHSVTLVCRDAQQASSITQTRINARYLPEITLPAQLKISADLEFACSTANLAVIATPIVGLRQALKAVSSLRQDLPAIWTCKGIELNSHLFAHEIAAQAFTSSAPYGVLTGPSFAQEVAKSLPCALTLASPELNFAQQWAPILHNKHLRIYTSPDLIGAEIAGAAKNVLAIASGISDGLGFGLNARAALITRGLAEIARLGVALGGVRDTFMGLSGMGDVILTCTGDLSRNRRVGLMLAKDMQLNEILQSLGHVAEGVPTTREILARAENAHIEMPVVTAVNAVLNNQLSPLQAVEELLSRDLKSELS